eukprot:46664-Alexandrium_andersonii.AAC.1
MCIRDRNRTLVQPTHAQGHLGRHVGPGFAAHPVQGAVHRSELRLLSGGGLGLFVFLRPREIEIGSRRSMMNVAWWTLQP